MKNLTTRKLVFGLLMAFVLTFSVQGAAEAITKFTRGSGDLKWVVPKQRFTIKFSVGLQSRVLTNSAYQKIPAGHASLANATGIHYYDSSQYVLKQTEGETRPVLDKDNIVTENAAFHFNEESIKIVASGTTGTGATIDKIGSYDITDGSEHTLNETGKESAKLSSSVSATFFATGPGVFTVTISDETDNDTTDAGDYPSTHSEVDPDLVFTVYVVHPSVDVDATGLSIGVTEQNYIKGGDNNEDQAITLTLSGGTNNTNVKTTYNVEGPGSLYIEADGRKGPSGSRNFITSSVAPVKLKMNGGTNKVTVSVISTTPKTAIFIFGRPNVEIISGNNQTGASGGRLEKPLAVRVKDGKNRTISGLAVTFNTNSTDAQFIPVPGTTVYTDADGGLTGTWTDFTKIATSTQPAPFEDILVQTDSRGEATTYFKLGTGDQEVTVTAAGFAPLNPSDFSFNLETGTGIPSIEIVSGNNQRANSSGNIENPLVVKVTELGNRKSGVSVTFTASRGILKNTAPPGTTASNLTVTDTTDSQGLASVTYVLDYSGPVTVTASITGTSPLSYLRKATFNINGSGSTTTNQTTQTTTTQTTTTVGGTGDDPEPDEIEIVSGDDQTGVPGTALSDPFVVRVIDDAGEPVENVRVYFDIDSGGGRLSRRSQRTDDDGEAETILTLGASAGENKVTATLDDDDLNVDDVEFTATAIAQPEEIAIVSGNNQTGSANRALSEAFVVKVTDESGNPVENVRVTFRVRSGPGLFPGGTRITDTTNTQGIAESQRLALTATAFGTVRVTAEAGGAGSVTFTVNAGDPPDALISISGNNQSGAPGSKLKAPFVVEVLDKDDEPMSGVTVIFKITAGGGKIAPTRATTNSSGRAQTTLTLGKKGGNNTVVASVAGLSRTVTFKAKASAIVLVNAAERPPLYWISSSEGTLHRLVEDQTEDLASNVKGVTSLAIDTQNSLLYFGVKTSAETGAIRRSNLNGSNVRTVLSFASVPKDIALDSNGSTLYLVTAGGHLQKVNTQGAARLVTIRQNLPALSAIAVSNGYVYWAEMLGRLRRISLTAKNPAIQDLVTGLDAPISLSISKGKLYWMQRSAQGDGRLQHANLDGTNIQSLKYFASGPPAGFTVNTSENKIYWTLDDGKIQQANIWGQSARDLVAGLPNPGAIAVGTRAAQAPVTSQPTQTTQTTTQQTTQQPTTYSKYDVNKDGKINNADTRAVAVAVGQSGNAITNPRTDVDGSGTVDVTDIILVLANLDDDVAAPAIDVDFKALDVDFDRLQEQVEMLLASGDRSIAAQRALLYLQHLLASARPDETALLANYPNPFNPETWIPYHLAESTPVRINIYDAQGILIRVLTVGHQSAGYYTSRSRAAYWDGRNALGERVASGIYFYQLQTDALSPLRKMVILK